MVTFVSKIFSKKNKEKSIINSDSEIIEGNFNPFKYTWFPSMELIVCIKTSRDIYDDPNVNKYLKAWERFKLYLIAKYILFRVSFNKIKMNIYCFFVIELPEKIDKIRYGKYYTDDDDDDEDIK